MLLRANLAGESRYGELLAVVEVESDTGEQFGEGIRRTIVGTVVRRGPVWQEYMAFWGPLGHRTDDDGREYFTCRFLQVDHDFYGNDVVIHLIGDAIRMLVVEMYPHCTVEQYAETVRARNTRVQQYIDRWDKYQITRNDIRELTGHHPLEGKVGEEALTPGQIDEFRNLAWVKTVTAGLSRNTVV